MSVGRATSPQPLSGRRHQIGVGVIGGGFSGRAHIEAIRRTGMARSISLADLADPARYGSDGVAVDVLTDDYRHLLADETIDVVHNCVPNTLHAEVSAAALAAGKHVISEKPLAISAKEADDLQRLAEESGLIHAVCFNYRFFPLVQEARARIARGDVGRPILVHGGYLQDWLLRQTDYNWRVSVRDGGRSRVVADIGSHWLDLVSFLLADRVTEVFAVLGRIYDQRLRPTTEEQTFAETDGQGTLTEVDTEDWATSLLRFESGVSGQMVVSEVSAGSKNALWLQIDGTNASLRWEQEHPEELWIGHRSVPNELVVKSPEILSPGVNDYIGLPAGHIEGWHAALTRLIGAVYRTIRLGEPHDFPTFADGANAVRVVEAILNSNRAGTWQPVPQAIPTTREAK